MKRAETAPERRESGIRVDCVGERNEFIEYVLLVLHMPFDPLSRRSRYRVKALIVHTVEADHLDHPPVDQSRQRLDDTFVLIVVKSSDPRRKCQQPNATIPEAEKLHCPPERFAFPFVVETLHDMEGWLVRSRIPRAIVLPRRGNQPRSNAAGPRGRGQASDGHRYATYPPQYRQIADGCAGWSGFQ